MIDETDISKEVRWYAEKISEKAVKALLRTRFEAEYVETRQEALAKIIALIPEGGTVGAGDSVTLHEVGFFDWLRQQKEHEIYNAFFVDRSKFPDEEAFKAERYRMCRKALTSDVFVSGTNAITLNGELVNMDGNGNRVAAMIFGPGRVVVVAGFNKIVQDFDEAVKKIARWTAPMNLKRHTLKHAPALEKVPCVIAGTCQHCNYIDKGCQNLTLIKGWSPNVKVPENYPTHIIIVGEKLGI